MMGINEHQAKVTPHSIEAEQSIIGSIFIDPEALEKISDIISPNDFYHGTHRVIYEHILTLYAENNPIDVTSLAESLERSEWLDKIGGYSYIAELSESATSSANIKNHAKIVKDKAILRKLVAFGNEMLDTVFHPEGKTTKNMLDVFESKLMTIGENVKNKSEGFVNIKKILMKEVEELERLHGREDLNALTGIATGFHDLDQKTMGLHPGDLIVVAGRPSMGKTAFSINIAENAALATNETIAIFSMEMGSQQLARRMIGSLGRINQNKLRSGNLEDNDWAKLSTVMGKLNESKIFMDETPALNCLEIRSRSRRLMKQEGKIGLIVIDYLQLMHGVIATDNRVNEISEITRSLKALAKELQVPIIILSQLNRSLESRPNKRPIMSDLRESGAIEQDADLILFLYRDEVYNSNGDQAGIAEVIIGKHRNGETGTIKLAWIGEHTRFESLARDWQPSSQAPRYSDDRFDRM